MERIDSKPRAAAPQWSLTEMIQQVWTSLTHPHASIVAKDERRQARLLATMLFVVVVLGGLFLALIGLTRAGSWRWLRAEPHAALPGRGGHLHRAAVCHVRIRPVY